MSKLTRSFRGDLWRSAQVETDSDSPTRGLVACGPEGGKEITGRRRTSRARQSCENVPALLRSIENMTELVLASFRGRLWGAVCGEALGRWSGCAFGSVLSDGCRTVRAARR